ncbi:hypothetical protein OC844_007737, partial [Tilletia horrida]
MPAPGAHATFSLLSSPTDGPATPNREITHPPPRPPPPRAPPAPHTPRRPRSSSVPASPIEDLRQRRVTRAAPAPLSASPTPEPPATGQDGTTATQLEDILLSVLGVVNPAVPSQQLSQKWKPLNKKSLVAIKTSVERGLAILRNSNTNAPSARQPPHQCAANTSTTRAPDQLQQLTEATRKMQDDLRALTTALTSRPTFAQVTSQSPPGAAAAPSASQGTIPPPLNPQTRLPTIKTRHRVILNTQGLPDEHPARRCTTDQLLAKIAGPVHHAIKKRPLTIDRLRSGDIAVNLANQKEVDALLQANASWISTAFLGHTTLPKLRRQDFSCTRSLVVHGVPFELGDGDELRKELGEQNDATFTASRWLTSEASRTKSGKQFGSVIVTINDSGDRARLLKRGLIGCQNRQLNVVAYLPKQ